MRTTRGIVDRMLAEGLSERQVARELEGELRKAGWWGKRVLKDGRVVRLGSAHRIKTILRTNMHTAYAAGRYRQQKEGAAARPWWRYVAIQDNATRLAHRQLHGKILRHDDPAWEAIYPPNGFNCRCRVATMTEEQASRAADGDRIDGTRVERRDLPVGVDSRTGEITHEPTHRPGARVTLTDRRGFERRFSPDAGWAYRPGKSPLVNTPLTPAEARLVVAAARANARVRKTESGGRRWALVAGLGGYEKYGEVKVLPGHKPPAALAAGAGVDEGEDIARGVFGVAADGFMPFGTPLGPVVIRGNNFKHVVENRRQKREQYANRIPETLDDPDEIWRALYLNDDGRTEWRRHYIRAYDDKKAGFVVATETPDGAVFFNFIPRKSINARRVGILLYTRARGLLHGIE